MALEVTAFNSGDRSITVEVFSRTASVGDSVLVHVRLPGGEYLSVERTTFKHLGSMNGQLRARAKFSTDNDLSFDEKYAVFVNAGGERIKEDFVAKRPKRIAAGI